MMLFVKFQNAVNESKERGAAMAEYGLLLALVALAAVLTLATFGDSIVAVFTAADAQLNSNIPAQQPAP